MNRKHSCSINCKSSLDKNKKVDSILIVSGVVETIVGLEKKMVNLTFSNYRYTFQSSTSFLLVHSVSFIVKRDCMTITNETEWSSVTTNDHHVMLLLFHFLSLLLIQFIKSPHSLIIFLLKYLIAFLRKNNTTYLSLNHI